MLLCAVVIRLTLALGASMNSLCGDLRFSYHQLCMRYQLLFSWFIPKVALPT